MSRWIDDWADDLTEQSGGRLTFEILHGSQMGPPPRYYDIARNAQADITWILHGATPGRFELTEISGLPFLFCSAEQATQVLNHQRLRSQYLDDEHRGVKVLMLFMHPPGQINTKGAPVLTVADMKGKAIRPPSASVGEFLAALGANPVGMPPTALAEGLQKNTIDGAMIDHGGAGIAFQLGPHLDHSTEVDAYTTSFGLVMNEDSFDSLPQDLRDLLIGSLDGEAGEVGALWDDIDDAGKKVLAENGVAFHQMSEEELAELKEIGDGVTDAYLRRLDAAGKPGSEVYAMMRDLVEEVGPVGCDDTSS
jgi:TRAP-type C4-dicarboxylate transport system substrate-binding protein